MARSTQLDHELIAESRAMFQKVWKRGEKVRLIGMGVSGFDSTEGQLSLVEGEKNQRAKAALAAVDRIREQVCWGEERETGGGAERGPCRAGA